MKNQPMTTVLTIFDLKKTMEEKSLVVVEQPQNVQTASVLVSLEYERKDHSHVAYYKAVPLKAA